MQCTYLGCMVIVVWIADGLTVCLLVYFVTLQTRSSCLLFAVCRLLHEGLGIFLVCFYYVLVKYDSSPFGTKDEFVANLVSKVARYLLSLDLKLFLSLRG